MVGYPYTTSLILLWFGIEELKIRTGWIQLARTTAQDH
jgi:hypothetical protein